MQLRALDEGAESVLQKRRPIARRDDQRDEISRGAQLSLAAVEVLESVGRCRGSEVVKIKRRQMARLPDELVAGVHAVRREEPETSVKKNCGGALEPLLTAELQRHHFQNALDKMCKQNDENDGGTACCTCATGSSIAVATDDEYITQRLNGRRLRHAEGQAQTMRASTSVARDEQHGRIVVDTALPFAALRAAGQFVGWVGYEIRSCGGGAGAGVRVE